MTQQRKKTRQVFRNYTNLENLCQNNKITRINELEITTPASLPIEKKRIEKVFGK